MVLIFYDEIVILKFIRTNPLLVTFVYFFFFFILFLSFMLYEYIVLYYDDVRKFSEHIY